MKSLIRASINALLALFRWWIVGVAILLSVSSPRIYASTVIGEVVFVVGDAALVRGGQEGLTRGRKLLSGDILQTGLGAHIHIRFIDGAILSVRPDSHLIIEQYQYDVDAPSQSRVKFRLLRGAARSITGQAGNVAKDQFRLNTPLAAIGVRGTDFIVFTNEKQSSVVVNTGAVIVSPFGGSCSPDSLGPCIGGQSRLLSGDMQGMYAQIESSGVKILPIPRPFPDIPPHRNEPPSLVRKRDPTDHISSVDPRIPGLLMAGDVVIKGSSREGLSVPAESSSIAEAARELILAHVLAESAPQSQARTSLLSLSPSELIWGRWSKEPVVGDPSPAPIIENPAFSRMIVSDGINALFGSESSRSNLPREGRLDFTFRDGKVSLQSEGTLTAGNLIGGRLQVDFSDGSFSTMLVGTHRDIANPVVVYGAGSMRSDGLFRSILGVNGNADIVGVVVSEGKEAAYVFSRPVSTKSGATSIFLGLSRWGR